MRNLLFTCMLWFSSAGVVSAQSEKDTVNSIRTDAHLQSGNYRDVLTNFFQLAFQDLTGDNKQFQFSSNLFAIKLKTNPTLNLDKYYKHQTFWRNSNVDFDIRLSEKFALKGINLGYRYAIVNKRDVSMAKDFSKKLGVMTANLEALKSQMAIELSAMEDDAEYMTLLKAMNQFMNDSTFTYSKLPEKLKQLMTNYVGKGIEDDFSFRAAAKQAYDNLIDSYKGKLLWTLSGRAITNTKSRFTAGELKTRATAGLLQLSRYSNIEFDIEGGTEFFEDSLSLNKDIRTRMYATGSLNYVIRNANQVPFFEFKIGSSYQEIYRPIYQTKEFTLNGGLRLRVSRDIWVPVSFVYDVENANLFGYISVKSNFDWLTSIFGNLKLNTASLTQTR